MDIYVKNQLKQVEFDVLDHDVWLKENLVFYMIEDFDVEVCLSLFQKFLFFIFNQIEWNMNKLPIVLNAVYNVLKVVLAMEQLLRVVDYNYKKFLVISHHSQLHCE
jgi:hypothetical protein